MPSPQRTKVFRLLSLSLSFLFSNWLTPLCFTLASAPKSLKLYANRSKLGFNEVDSVPAEQELELSESDIEGAPIQLKFVKFQKVSNLQIFVENNQGGGEITRIDSLKFFGAPEQTPNVNNLKKVEE